MPDINGVIWITAFSGAGKTTVSQRLASVIRQKYGINPIILDGDLLRTALGDKIGHSHEDRLFLAGCYGRMAKLLQDQGHVVICATISMFHSVREWNRKNIPGYLEIYLRVPEYERKIRDTKRVYAGQNVVGMDIQAEEPANPDLVIDNYGAITPELAVEQILRLLTGARYEKS